MRLRHEHDGFLEPPEQTEEEPTNEYGQPLGGSRTRPGRRTEVERAILRMEEAFRMSFADIRIRTDSEAAARAASLGTKAYTQWNEVGFAAGQFAPHTTEGLHILAHEFAHLAQARGGLRAYSASAIDAIEADANRAADAVVEGRTPTVARVAAPGPLRYTPKVKPLGRAVEAGKPELHARKVFEFHFNPADKDSYDTWSKCWALYFEMVFGMDPATAKLAGEEWAGGMDPKFDHVERWVFIENAKGEAPFPTTITFTDEGGTRKTGGWEDPPAGQENLVFYVKWSQHDQIYWWVKKHYPADAAAFERKHPEWTPKPAQDKDADKEKKEPTAEEKHELAADENIPDPIPLLVVGDPFHVTIKHHEFALDFEIEYAGPYNMEGPALDSLTTFHVQQFLEHDQDRPFNINVVEHIDSTTTKDLEARLVLDLYGDGNWLVTLRAVPSPAAQNLDQRKHTFITNLNGRHVAERLVFLNLPGFGGRNKPKDLAPELEQQEQIANTTIKLNPGDDCYLYARRFGDSNHVHLYITGGAGQGDPNELVQLPEDFEDVTLDVLVNTGRNIELDLDGDGDADVFLVHTVLQGEPTGTTTGTPLGTPGETWRERKHFLRSFDKDKLLLKEHWFTTEELEAEIPFEEDELKNPPDTNVEWPADRAPGQKNDPIGALPEPIRRSGDIIEMRVDADGDRSKELLLRFHPVETKIDSTLGDHTLHELRVQVKQLSTATMKELHFSVPEGALRALWPGDPAADRAEPRVDTVADGKNPMHIVLCPGLSLWISPPAAKGPRSYVLQLGKGKPQEVAFPEDPAGMSSLVQSSKAAPNVGGVASFEMVLGEYGDRFRFTFEKRSEHSGELGIAALRKNGQVAHARGLTLDARGWTVTKELRGDPRAVEFDLDDDGKADIQVHDQLSSPTLGSPAPPSIDRDHILKISGDRIVEMTGQSADFNTWCYFVRNGEFHSTEMSDPRAAGAAMAIDQLAEQAADGKGTDKALIRAEAELIAARRRALIANIISTRTFDAWKTLSEAMIALESQVEANKVDPALQHDAAAKAAELVAAIDEDSQGKALYVPPQYGHGVPHGGVGGSNKPPNIGEHLSGMIAGGDWKNAFGEYRSVVSALDRWIAERFAHVRGDESEEAQLQRHHIAMKRELGMLEHGGKTNLVRIPAVYLPDAGFVGPDGTIKQVPLTLFAFVRNKHWHVRDITSPTKPFETESDEEHKDGETVPPLDLLVKMAKYKRHFPPGVIRYEIDGKGGPIVSGEGTAWETIQEWLEWIGLAAAVVGFALIPGGQPVAAYASVAFTVSAVAGIAAAGIDLYERSQHGAVDGVSVILNVASIVANLTGIGRIALAPAAQAASKAGNFAKLAQIQGRQFVLARTQAAADSVYLAVFLGDTYDKLSKIESESARIQLLTQALALGGMTIISVKGDWDIKNPGSIVIDNYKGLPIVTDKPAAPRPADPALPTTAAEHPKSPTVPPESTGKKFIEPPAKLALIRGNPEYPYADKATYPDGTKVYRWAPFESGMGSEGTGSSFWQTEVPHPGYANRWLLESTVGELRQHGELRVDTRATAGDGGVSLQLLHHEGVGRVPGKRSGTRGLSDPGNEPVWPQDHPDYKPVGRWRDWDFNMHFGEDGGPAAKPADPAMLAPDQPQAKPKTADDPRSAADAKKDPNEQRRYDRYEKGRSKPLPFEEWWEKFGKKVPHNKHGGKGDPVHQATVYGLFRRAHDEFPDDIIHMEEFITGYKTPKGKVIRIKRKPDVWVEDAKNPGVVKKIYEAARTNKDGSFVSREMAKKKQYDALGIPSHFQPVLKDPAASGAGSGDPDPDVSD